DRARGTGRGACGGDRARDERRRRALAGGANRRHVPERDRADGAGARPPRARRLGTRRGRRGRAHVPQLLPPDERQPRADGEPVTSPLATRRVPTLPPEPLRTLGANIVRRALLAVDDAETGGRRPPRWATGVARLPSLLGLRLASR